MHWSGEAGKFSETINGIISIPFHSRLFSPSSYVSFLTSIDRSIDRSSVVHWRQKKGKKKKRTSALLFGKFTTVYLSRFPRLSHMWHSLFLLFLFCLPLTSNNFVFILFCTLKPAKRALKLGYASLLLIIFAVAKFSLLLVLNFLFHCDKKYKLNEKKESKVNACKIEKVALVLFNCNHTLLFFDYFFILIQVLYFIFLHLFHCSSKNVYFKCKTQNLHKKVASKGRPHQLLLADSIEDLEPVSLFQTSVNSRFSVFALSFPCNWKDPLQIER